MKTKYLSQDELKRLFSVITSKRDKAIFLIAYRHGLRASEIGMIRVDDVNFQTARIRIERLKGSLGGTYPMQADEIKAVKAWIKERDGIATVKWCNQRQPSTKSPWLFTSNRGTPISRDRLDDLMKIYGDKAGIPADRRHFHVLKHSIGTHLRAAGADIRFIQVWLGHANIQNAARYEHIDDPERDEKARQFFASPKIVGG